MKYTPNYNLKKPDTNETVGPGAFNDNADIIDQVLAAKQATTNSLTEETNLDSSDYIAIYDASADTHKRAILGAVGIWLKSVFDSVYAKISHNHTKADITDFTHNHVKAEISDFGHTHTKSGITDFPTSMTPTAHKSSHATGGTDVLAPSEIGASTRISGTGTLAVASWVGSAAPYSCDFAIAGLLAADTPHVDRVTGTDAAAAKLINTAWGLVAGYDVKPQTSAGKITFYASAKPTVAIPIMWEVVRS